MALERKNTPSTSQARPAAPQLLTIEAVYQRLECSRSLAYGLCASGALPSIRITPRAVRVAEDDLAEFIASRRESIESTDY